MSQSLSTRLTKCGSADPRLWRYLSETHFLTFSSNKIYDVLILPRVYQADDLRMSLTSMCYSHIYFSADDSDMPRSDYASSSALFVYMRIHVPTPIRLCRCISVA